MTSASDPAAASTAGCSVAPNSTRRPAARPRIASAFASVNPGAGFVDVKNYQKLSDKLDTIPWWEQKLWNLYDPLACPINFVNTSLIAYSGEIDAQKAAAGLDGVGVVNDRFVKPLDEAMLRDVARSARAIITVEGTRTPSCVFRK